MKTIRTVYLQDVVSIIDNDDITSIIVHGKVYDKVKFGEWIGKPIIGGYSRMRCSVCGDVFLENNGKWKYCPHCGAKMVEE